VQAERNRNELAQFYFRGAAYFRVCKGSKKQPLFLKNLLPLSKKQPILGMNRINFKHTLPIQLRFNDVDSFGHVNNTVYFSFYDLGKTTYFAKLRKNSPALTDAGIVIVNLQADFLAPIFPTEQIAVQSAVIEIGNKSFKMFQRVINTDTNEVKCTCQTILVGFDKETNTSQPIAPDWKTAIAAFEENDAIVRQ
jgi:acyl-CoA thioester hydrolase